MDLSRQQRDWDDLAQVDAMWAILSRPEKRNQRWETPDFFATGITEAEEIQTSAASFGFTGRFHFALDFGCGWGRVTRALQSFCDEVTGVDISPEMLRDARTHAPGCTFVHCSDEHLGCFPTERFDLIYTRRVLQHQRTTGIILQYVGELMRVLKPGGFAEVQVPASLAFRHRLQPKRRLYDLLRSAGASAEMLHRRGLNPIAMNAASPETVCAVVEQFGGRVLKIADDDSAPQSKTYYITKPDVPRASALG